MKLDSFVSKIADGIPHLVPAGFILDAGRNIYMGFATGQKEYFGLALMEIGCSAFLESYNFYLDQRRKFLNSLSELEEAIKVNYQYLQKIRKT